MKRSLDQHDTDQRTRGQSGRMLLVSLIFASQVQVAETREAPRAWLWPGASASTRLTSGGQTGVQLGISYRLAEWFEPEALAAIGVFGAPGAELEVVDRFSFGARLLYPIEHVRPFLWFALRHEHQAQQSAILRDPISTTLGFSDTGVAHKTGGEAGFGFDLAIPVDETPVLASLRIGTVVLPSFGAHAHGDQLGLFVDVSAGLPMVF